MPSADKIRARLEREALIATQDENVLRYGCTFDALDSARIRGLGDEELRDTIDHAR